mmetsp:Transcript_125337/g.348759  ORF Transcript_125337/g.348759 Transcript_125337/m.348759 type:complete len:142 (-) Transcript_125337:44-469(-)
MGNAPAALCAMNDPFCCSESGVPEFQPMQVTTYAAIGEDRVNTWSQDPFASGASSRLAERLGCGRNTTLMAYAPGGAILIVEQTDQEDLGNDKAENMFKGGRWVEHVDDEAAPEPHADSLQEQATVDRGALEDCPSRTSGR